MKKIKLSLILALVFGLCGIAFIYIYLKSNEKILNEAYAPAKILIAKRYVSKGTILSEEDISSKAIPEKFYTKDLLRAEEINNLLGKITAKDTEDGEMFSFYFLKDQNGNALSSEKLEKNKRLVPLFENIESESKMELNDKDLVDVILTYKKGNDETTKTILQNIEVKKTQTSNPDGGSEPNIPLGNRTYLVMTPFESQIFMHSVSKGKINFVLRNPDDKATHILEEISDKNFEGLSSGEKALSKTNQKNGIEIISSSF